MAIVGWGKLVPFHPSNDSVYIQVIECVVLFVPYRREDKNDRLVFFPIYREGDVPAAIYFDVPVHVLTL